MSVLISYALMSGVDLYNVGRLLGLADVAPIDRYAHLADQHVSKAETSYATLAHVQPPGARGSRSS